MNRLSLICHLAAAAFLLLKVCYGQESRTTITPVLCYHGNTVNTSTIPCSSGLCSRLVTQDGKFLLDCGSQSTCSKLGDCQNDADNAGTCCCRTEKCNTVPPLKCFSNKDDSGHTVECPNRWCVNQTAPGTYPIYDCDPVNGCPGIGNKCNVSNGATICCCDTAINCNKGAGNLLYGNTVFVMFAVSFVALVQRFFH